MSTRNANPTKHKPKLGYPLIALGLVFLLCGTLILGFIFYPILIEEMKYAARSVNNTTSGLPETIKPVDEEFGILIPKINANAPVVGQVDPFDANAYQRALTKGVAHAKGTALPNQPGNTFLFSHSAGNILEANRYNSVFYLLDKLEKGDEIHIYFKKMKLAYQVSAKRLVSPADVSYLSTNALGGRTLTLMTCWPPGTTYKRLIIEATPVGTQE